MRLFTGTLLASFAVAGCFVAYVKREPERRLAALEQHARIQPLDLVFQDLDCGPGCDFMRQITDSRYTHVGIVLLEENGERVVWESFGEVGPTPLAEWVERTHGQVAVYRFDEGLLEEAEAAIAFHVRNMRGDTGTSSSELIVQAVRRATGTTLIPLRAVSRLSHGQVVEVSEVATPFDLARSPHLTKIAGEL